MDLDKQLDRILYECVVVDRVRAKAAIKKLIDEAVLEGLPENEAKYPRGNKHHGALNKSQVALNDYINGFNAALEQCRKVIEEMR